MVNQHQYLVQFLATLSGNKLVVSGLKQMEKGTTRLTKTTKTAVVANKSMANSMMSLAKRAMMVAPIWMLLRGAIMMVTTTIRDVIQANMDFQVQMARIKTVVSASSKSIESDMTKIRSVILDTAANSTASLKDLAEAFYFLRTSNLSTEEAIAAFKPSVDLAIGTLNKLGETARTVAGIYATMGKHMDSNLSLTQKFTKIADGLAYTYATQEVQMKELMESYIKFAPYISGMKESWTEIVTVLGFLNTKQLKAGRSGRLLGRTMLQLVKNSSKLAHIFGITFAPDEPISFLKIIKEINTSLAVSGKITAAQSKSLQAVFGTRGGVPTRLLLASFEELTDLIDEAENKMGGFAERMGEIMKKTVPAQMQRTKNILAVLANEFFSAAAGGGDFVDVLVKMNDSLEDMRAPLKEGGLLLGWYLENLKKLANFAEKLGTHKIGFEVAVPQLAGLKSFINLATKAQTSLVGLISYDEYAEKQKESEKLTKERIALQDKFKDSSLDTSKMLMDNMKAEQVIQKNIINLMKKRGATEVEISEYKIKNFSEIAMWMEDEEKYAKQLSLINDKINAEYSVRIKETKTLLSHHQKLHTMFGADTEEAAKLNYEIQRILFGENDVTRTLKVKLELEKEILKTKRGQYKYTSDEAKIYKIYKKYGYEAAWEMARVAAGRKAPSQVTPERQPILKEFFPEKIFAEELKGFAGGIGKSIMDLFKIQARESGSQALEEARKLKKIYTTAPVTEKQISMEISKLTLPEPVDVRVSADIKVDVNRDQLTEDINRIIKESIDKEIKENKTINFLRDNV